MRLPNPGFHRSRPVRIGLSVLLALTLGACASRPPRGATAAGGSDQDIASLMTPRDRERLQQVAAARTETSAAEGYRIGPDDLLDVSIPDLYQPSAGLTPKMSAPTAIVPDVSAAPTFAEGVRVSANGEINVPQVGIIHAGGLTTRELERELEHRLVSEGILRRPQVRVAIAEYRSGVVAVMGSVARPGLYPLTRPGATVADMIWAAGGPNDKAGRIVEFAPSGTASSASSAPVRAAAPNPASVPPARRAESGELRVADVRVEGEGSGRRLTIALTRAPDNLHEFALEGPPRIVIDVDGPVGDAGRGQSHFALQDSLVASVRSASRGSGQLRTVVDLSRQVATYSVRSEGSTIVADIGDPVLTAASAPAPSAEPASDPEPPARVAMIDTREGLAVPDTSIRVDLGSLLQDTGPGGLNPQVRPGDVVNIAPAGNVQVAGWVTKPGSYPITRNLTLSGAVAAAGGQMFPADMQRAYIKRVVGPGDERSYEVDLDAVYAAKATDIAITDGDYVYIPASPPKLVPWGIWTIVTSAFRIGASVF